MNLATMTLLALLGAPCQAPDEPAAATASKDSFKPDPGWKSLGPSIWFDAKTHRLLVRAKVVLRDGALEHLLCLNGTKEHEAILATGAAPRVIHAGLLLTGAEPGHPVKFLPKFEPPTGTPIKIELEWEEDGKPKQADAREWIFNDRDKKAAKTDWVFAGSELIIHPFTKKPYYTAEDGDLITVSNFGNAILDLPFASTATDADRVYVARKEKIPPLGTWVTMAFSPREEEKKAAQREANP